MPATLNVDAIIIEKLRKRYAGLTEEQVRVDLHRNYTDTWNGVVDLCGAPAPVGQSASALVGSGVVESSVSPVGGLRVYMTAEAFRRWLRHPSFRMVK